jgi:hypothetical protein
MDVPTDPVARKKTEALDKEAGEVYSVEYKKLLNLGNIEDAKLRDFLQEVDPRLWSQKNRLTGTVRKIKYNYAVCKTGIITTCFKVTYDSTSCIYGFLHSICSDPLTKKPINHKFICTGPTYRSQDGEYRGRLISYDQIAPLFERYADVFSKVEDLVLKKLESGRMEFHVDFYYPECEYKKDQLEDQINTLRLPIKLYIMCWIVDFYNIHYKVVENHINPAYQYIIYQLEDLPVFESIIAEIGKSQYTNVRDRISEFWQDVNSPIYNIRNIECGQKIFPITVVESIRMDDINFSVWREIYITNMASNLVLNAISASFPFIGSWFYIQHAHGGLFDNVAMYDKYLHSTIATDVSAQLRNIDRYNYVSGDKTKGPISGKFFKLSKNIHRSILYADGEIRLTDLAICVTSEYVGRTLRDIPSIIAYKEYGAGLDLVFTDYEIFSKHMFEFVYAFYTMNAKTGIIHGDLHMNNATINRVYTMLSTTGIEYVKNPRVVYVIGKTAYQFRHVGLFSTIIDFSRAILGDYSRIENEFGTRFADAYFKDQETRLLHIVFHHFPNVMDKFKEVIESLINKNFLLMFKILSAVDTFVIMSNIAAMFSIDDIFTHGQVKIAPGAMEMLRKLSTRAEDLVFSNIQSLVDGKISSPEDIEWPNLVIIQDLFADHVVDAAFMKDKTINIVEIFNSNNDIIYDMDDYETWGPMLSGEKIEALRKKYDLTWEEFNMWKTYARLDESKKIEDLTAKFVVQEKEYAEFEPWMIM